MPNQHSTLTGLFTDIASAIREKDGSSAPIIADAFPSAIRAIPSGGGGDHDAEDGIIMGTISRYTNERIMSIRRYAFYGYSGLTSISFPACTSIGGYAFYSCTGLKTISFPACTSIGTYAFYSCAGLETISFPACMSIGAYAFYSCAGLETISFSACTYIGDSAFSGCRNLTSISFPACTRINSLAFTNCTSLTSVSFPEVTWIASSAFLSCSSLALASFPKCSIIYSYAFQKCYNLLSLYLITSSVCKLQHSNVFSSTPIAGYTTSTGGVYGSIYVPMSLLSAYQASTNWTYFSSRFVGVNSEDV